MKLPPYLSTSFAAGAFLLAGSFALAQTTSAARNMHPRDAASGQSSGRPAESGSTPGMAVDHAGGNGVRRADTGKSGDNPLYEGKGKANLKPGAGSSAVPYKDPEDMTTRYRPGNNKTTRNANAQGETAGQSPQGGAQRKSGSIIAADRNSAHAAEALSPSNGVGNGSWHGR